jgi:serine/threonine-protein kinase
MGVVYKAHDRELDEVVALKLLRPDVAASPELARRFRAEIRLARKVGHRNVCRIYEYGADGPFRYIAMEYIDGVDVKQVIRNHGALPVEDAFAVGVQVADGLAAIHELGIVHRDLKTSNIMVDSRGVARVMDFGIAKELAGDATGATATGQVMGTPEYMSPEQARADRVDSRSDVYSLGVVLYELFTGQLPFRGDTPLAIMLKQFDEPPPLDGIAVPDEVRVILRRALAKRPVDRFASGAELAEGIRRAQAARFPGAPPGPRPHPSYGRVDEADVPALTPAPESGSVASPNDLSTELQTPHVPTRPARAEGPAGRLGSPPPRSIVRPVRTPRGSARGRKPGLATASVTIAIMVLGAGALVRWLSQSPASATAERSAPARVAAPDSTPLASGSGKPAVSPAPRATIPTAPEAHPTAVSSLRPTPAATPRPTPTPAAPSHATAQPTEPPATPRTTLPTEQPPTNVASPPPTAAAASVATSLPSEPPASTTAPRMQPPLTSAPAQAVAFLQLVVVPWANVAIGDKALGRKSSEKIACEPGQHVLVFDHPDYRPLRRKVTLLPGETARLVVDLAEEAVRR